MRVKANLRFEEISKVPYNHLFELMSASLNKIGEVSPDLAYKYHEKPKYKPYNLSWINVDVKKTDKHGITPKNSKANYYFSSPKKELTKSFVEGFLENPELTIKKQKDIKFKLDSIQSLEEPKFEEKMVFETITPIAVRTQTKNGDGELKTIDLRPNSKKFYDNLFQNLINRYKDYYDKEPKKDLNELDFRFIDSKPKRLKIKDTWQMSTQMKFEINATEQINRFIYYTGLGERNNQGFGCLKAISN
ncbi:MAG: CRISPR-Cas system related protein Cas6, RAMP superfamily [Candidatus Methanohalarchaeum thermophilum]|uniref:CRISPR-associated endoribonuclease n=1 Tax=Methanohalarchaeum thermophilum TaxID=1903181 RepID=A0A1Q6DWJ5_METT1|nr:MAG: CRISPR-Cas system related protein Cas6, RAMP superfamily [Candidatus Methanohalarchaeum thermophilum]